jgi:hypothetical protein
MKTSKRTKGSRKRSARPRSPVRTKAPRRPALPAYSATLAFASFAAKLHLRWYVFGAVAVNLHGFPRTTADVDITIDLGDLDPHRFVLALAKAGFAARFADDAFIAATHVIPVSHVASATPMDLVLAGPGLEQQFLDGAVEMIVGGRRIPVIGPEHLVVTKVLAGRAKDLEDVRELVAMRSLDHSKIEEMLGQLEEAIDDSELVTTYRRLRGEH